MKRILWGLLILLTLIVSGCGAGGKVNGADTGTDTPVVPVVPSATALTVDFTVPIDNATGVTVTDPFYMIFNKALYPQTVTETSFFATCGSNPVVGFTADYDTANNAVVVKPPSEGWPGGQECRITARKGYVKDSSKVALASDQIFTFSTGAGGIVVGTTPLAVVSTIPLDRSIDSEPIPGNTTLTFIFNKPLDAAYVVPTSIKVVCGGSVVSGFSVSNITANNSIKLTPPAAGWGSDSICNITLKKTSLLAADKQNMPADYLYSIFTTPPPGVPAINRLSLSADKYSVKSTGTDLATVTVTALDADSATVSGVTIKLKTDNGQLSTSSVTTGANGAASFTFKADSTRANGVATITASSGVVTPVSLPMTISGTTLVLTANKSVTKTGLADDITLTGTLKDADNSPIVLSNVTVASTLGNTLKDVATSVSGSPITVKTNNSGTFTLTYSAVNVGVDTITATGFGATGTATLTVTNSTFAFIDPLPNAVVNCNDTQPLTVHWTNDFGAAAAGNVTFSATNGAFAGGLKTQTVATDVNGDATVTYTASGIASPDTITATAGALQTVLPLDIRASNPTQLFVQATSTVIGIKTPGNTPASTIIATVLDPIGNPVAGKSVSFSLIAGAGGGEFLSPPTAVTDSAGQAKTTFYAGTAASLQNGVIIRASIAAPLLTDTVNLTISGAAASIIFGTTNEIGAVSVGGYVMAYEMPVSVLVTDINGGPVANQSISIGIYPTQFETGIAVKPEGASEWSWVTSAVFNNEDLDRNAILAAAEDGALGICIDAAAPFGLGTCTNGETLYYHSGAEGQIADMRTAKVPLALNGRLDPRNVATVPMEVITDANGLALIKIIYPKSYCNWINAELSATTQVSGTETRAVYNTNLSCMDNDEPYASSPFGY